MMRCEINTEMRLTLYQVCFPHFKHTHFSRPYISSSGTLIKFICLIKYRWQYVELSDHGNASAQRKNHKCVSNLSLAMSSSNQE